MTRFHRTSCWLTHRQYTWLIKHNAPDWTFVPGELLEALGHKIMCLIDGHKPYRDICQRPEHDVCARCNKSMPGLAEP